MHKEQSRRASRALEAFLVTPLRDALERQLREDPRDAVVAHFHSVAASVPAYPSFLAEHDVDPLAIRTYDDFRRVPQITKQNYLLRHPLGSLCRGGQLAACDMVAVSSGSTGKPAFWPRSFADELAIATRFEQVFRDGFRADRRTTLAVVCFALGTWVGGMFTASCCRHLATKGYPITVVTPGTNRDELFRILEDLAPAFEQVVLLGYPPFLKDAIDAGRARGVPWAELHTRLVLAGEVFSERWRSLVAERIGSRDPEHDFASLYGTADAGVLGNETPLSIAARRFLAERPAAARELFGQERLPTLVQYDPLSRFFEVEDGMLLFSGDGGVPLVRYGILDGGGLFTFEGLLAALRDLGFDPAEALPDDELRPLPFVYVFGRSDFTVSYFGANVYPETVTLGLERESIRGWVTGKFVMQVEETSTGDSALSIAVELAPGEAATEDRRRLAAAAIVDELLQHNSEFKSYVPEDRREVRVSLLPAGAPSHFAPGGKHRYTRK